jgi:hypothetical protein
LDPEEEPARGEFGPAPEDVRSQGFANISWQRQPVLPPTLTWNYDFAARPVEVLQFECSNLACSQPHSAKQHKNGPVASASYLGLVAAGEQTRELPRLQTLGQLNTRPARHCGHRIRQSAAQARVMQEAKQRAQPLDPVFGGTNSAVRALLRDEPRDSGPVKHLDTASPSQQLVEEQLSNVFVLDHGGFRHATLEDQVLAVPLE